MSSGGSYVDFDINDFNDPGVRFEGDALAGLGGVDTGEGGLFYLQPNGDAGYQVLGIEGDRISGGGPAVSFLQGTVTYEQVPEPGAGLLFPVALLSLAFRKLVAKLRGGVRPRPTCG